MDVRGATQSPLTPQSVPRWIWAFELVLREFCVSHVERATKEPGPVLQNFLHNTLQNSKQIHRGNATPVPVPRTSLLTSFSFPEDLATAKTWAADTQVFSVRRAPHAHSTPLSPVDSSVPSHPCLHPFLHLRKSACRHKSAAHGLLSSLDVLLHVFGGW